MKQQTASLRCTIIIQHGSDCDSVKVNSIGVRRAGREGCVCVCVCVCWGGGGVGVYSSPPHPSEGFCSISIFVYFIAQRSPQYHLQLGN